MRYRHEFDAAGEELRAQFRAGDISAEEYRDFRQDRMDGMLDDTGELADWPAQSRFVAMLVTREEMIAQEATNALIDWRR